MDTARIKDVNGKFLTMDQVCEKLQVSKTWLYRKCRAGVLPHIRIGAVIRFEERELENWIGGHKVKGALKI